MCNDRNPLVRFDQYQGFSDSREHKDRLLAEAIAVKQAANERRLQLSIKTANVGPQPFWCEEILATVSKTDILTRQLDEALSTSRCLGLSACTDICW